MSQKLPPGNEELKNQSRFSELEIPEFKSDIPEALLKDKDEIEKILYKSTNIQNQQLN